MPDLSHVCNLYRCSWQLRILNPVSKARDGSAASWVLVRFVTTESQWGLLLYFILCIYVNVYDHCFHYYSVEYTHLFVKFLSFSFFFFCFFRAAVAAYGSSQATGLIGATAAGLRHSHSNARSEPHLRPTPQLTAVPYP